MKKGQILPLIAIVVSVGAMLIALYRSTHLEWDGVMFGMAMLSAIVVLLIGWNIYTLIDIKEMRDQVAIDKKESYLESKKNSTTTYTALSDYYSTVLKGNDQEEVFFKCLFCNCIALAHAHGAKQNMLCKYLVGSLKDTISVGSAIGATLSANDKKALIAQLLGIDNARLIEDVSYIITLISHIEEAH